MEGAVAVSAGEVAVVPRSTTRRTFTTTSPPAGTATFLDFVMETEGVSFPEAVERLASMAGMAVPAATPDAARMSSAARRCTT